MQKQRNSYRKHHKDENERTLSGKEPAKSELFKLSTKLNTHLKLTINYEI
jgi:hypothetical protein